VGLVEDDRLTRVLIVDMINRESNLELAGHWGSAEEFYENGMKVPMGPVAGGSGTARR